MNKLLFALSGILLICSSLFSADFCAAKPSATTPNQSKSVLIEEGFEGSLIPPTGWTIVDADSDGHNWRYDPQFAHHNGSKAISSESYSSTAGALTPDNYLITPPIAIPDDMMGHLNYWVSAQSGGWNYEHYSVMISTTGTSPADFTTTLFEETITAKDSKDPSTWYERNVEIPYSYAGKTVYIAFRHYNITDMFALNLDDVQISVYGEVIPPIFNPPTGTSALINTDMDISVVVSHPVGIASVVGHYKLTGQTAWTDFTMTPNKVTNTYVGAIPEQPSPITGKIKFTATDLSNPSNTGDSQEFDIAWINRPYINWLEWGESYDTESGVGVSSAPWRAGADFDFGATTYWHPSALKIGVSTQISIPWVIRKTHWVNTNTILLGDIVGSYHSTINCNGVNDIIPTIASITDSTTYLTGHIALVFDMPPASYVTRDIEATSAHTFVNTELNDTLKTLTSLAPQFTGAWLMGIRVVNMGGSIETAEMLPGSSELKQNYPNPFNPSTTISFYNNMSGKVRLTVLNAKGETVATILNGNLSAGNHQAIFDGSNINSGVFFYRLETPTRTIVKKMLMIK